MTNEDLAKLYEHRSLLDLSLVSGLSVETVRRRLMKHGVKMRPPFQRLNDIQPRKPKSRLADLKYVGEPPNILYKQGACRECGIPLFGAEKKERDLCGDCSHD